MGNSYVNVLIRSADIGAVADLLDQLGRRAYVAGNDDVIVVYDERAEQKTKELEFLVHLLSSRTGRAALGFANYHDDALEYLLAESGQIVDRYNSYPGFMKKGREVPEGGDAHRLCMAFGAPEQEAAVEGLLRRTRRIMGPEIGRHEQLLEQLGIPTDFTLLGYEYVNRGELAEVAPHVMLRAVGGAVEPIADRPAASPSATVTGEEPADAALHATLVEEARAQRHYVNALILNDVLVPPRFEKLLGRGRQNGYVVLHRLKRHIRRQRSPLNGVGEIFRVDDAVSELLAERDVLELAVPRLLVRALGVTPLTPAEIAELDDRASALHKRFTELHIRAIEQTMKIGPLVG